MQFTKLKRWIKTLCENLRRNREKGAITVMETLIALVIGTAVLSGVFAGIPALQDARRSTTGINGLMQIATSIRSTFGTRNNFTGLTTALATQLAGFPRNFMDGTNVRHPWGGTVDIAVDPGNSQQFTITFNDVDDAGCTSVVTSTVDIAEEVDVGGTVVDLSAEDDSGTPEDESAAANIATLCQNDIEIEWTFSG